MNRGSIKKKKSFSLSIVAFIDHLLFIELIRFFKVIFPQRSAVITNKPV